MALLQRRPRQASDSRKVFDRQKLFTAIALLAWYGAFPGSVPPARGSAPNAAIRSDANAPDRDAAEDLKPKIPRGEQDLDRLAALSLYSTARLLEQKEDYPAALRLYQRALRLDRSSLVISRQIIPLAFSLGRPAVAVRYALLAAENDNASDPAVLERLAVHLTTQGEFDRALSLYEKIARLQKADKPDADVIVRTAQMAKLYVVAGKYREAAAAYRQIMQALLDKDSAVLDSRTRRLIADDAAKTLEVLTGTPRQRGGEAAAFELFGAILLKADDSDAAALAFDKARELAPDPANDAFHLAEIQEKRKELEAALQSLATYFEAKATTAGAAPYELLAKLLADLGKAEELVPRLEQMQAADPRNIPLAEFLAAKQQAAGNLPAAQRLYDACIQAKPSPDAYHGLLSIYRQNGQIDKLFDLVTSATSQPVLREAVDQELKTLVTDADTVSRLLERARQAAQGDRAKLATEQLLLVAQLALQAGRIDAAGEFYTLALGQEGADRPMIFRRWGLGLLLKDRYAESADVFRRAIDQISAQSDQAEFYYHLAGAAEMAGNTDDAVTAARKALALVEPNSAQFGDMFYRIASRLPWVYYHARRYEEAEQAYRALLDKFDNLHDSETAREILRDARLMLSNLAVINRRNADAEEWLEQILDEFPEDISALNDLGYLWADQGKHLARALAMTEKAVAAEPKNAAYLDSRGWALYKLARYQEALDVLQQAVGLETDPDGVMLDHLGDAYAALGKRAEAQAAWRRASQAFEKAKEMDKMKAVQQKLASSEARSVGTGGGPRKAA
jgi:tetratricopeptide (TPR) repeat protein